MLAAGGPGDRLAQMRLDQVEGGGADADHRHRGGVDERKKAAKPEPDRLAGPTERFALGPFLCPGGCSERLHVGVADIGHRLLVLARLSGGPPDRVIAGIGFDAAAASAAAKSAIGTVDHVPELAA
jgi:hypothetical protein